MPALLTRTSTWPRQATRLVPQRVGRRRLAQVGRKRVGRVAELVGELAEPPVAPHVVDDDRGALGGEGAGGRGADAAGRAGDEGDALALRAHEALRVVVGGDGHAVERVDAELERVERDRQDRHVVERVPAARLGLVEAGRRDDDELVVDPEAQREEVVRVAGVRQRGRVVRVDDVQVRPASGTSS